MSATPGGKVRDDQARLVTRLSSDYFLRSLHLLTRMWGGDIIAAIVVQAIIAANTAHLEVSGEGAKYAGAAEVPPDDVRKPISVLALAGSLGLPFETTRRYVNKLLAAGTCQRVAGGLIVPRSVLEHPRASEMMNANLVNVQRFVRSLRKAGVAIDG